MYLKSGRYREDLHAAMRATVHMERLYHKKILITGATGLIGSFLTDLLLYADKEKKADIEVFALARDKARLKQRFSSSLNHKHFHMLIQDVTEPLRYIEPVDYVIHAAGDGFPAAFREHPVETMMPALVGTYQLLQYAKAQKAEKFLFVSSGEIYGKTIGKTHAFLESECGFVDSMQVRSCYPMAKRCAETLCASFGKEYGVPIVVARLSHIYGACTSQKDNRATVQFLKNALAGEDIRLRSLGQQMRSYTYVADCVSGLLTVLINGAEGEAYNIANANSRATIAEFADTLAQRADVGCIVEEPDRNGVQELTPIEYAVLDAAKLESLGWRAGYTLRDGISNMFDTGTLNLVKDE